MIKVAVKVSIVFTLFMAGLFLFAWTGSRIMQAFGWTMGQEPFNPLWLLLIVPLGLFASTLLLILGVKLINRWVPEGWVAP